jgi:hypothetical protein
MKSTTNDNVGHWAAGHPIDAKGIFQSDRAYGAIIDLPPSDWHLNGALCAPTSHDVAAEDVRLPLLRGNHSVRKRQ